MKAASGALPIVYAYGRRWKRKHLELLPAFEGVAFSGIYVLYNDDGVPFYTGISENIPERLAGDHSKGEIADKWSSFSWFIIDPEMYFRDIEALCIKAYSSMEYGSIRGRQRSHTEVLGWNLDPSGIQREDSVWRNYWVHEVADGATLEAYNAESRSVLDCEARKRCRLKHKAGGSRYGDRVSAEKIVLGCALMEPGALETAVKLLEDRDFSVPVHRIIFHALRGLRAAGQVINVVTVTEFLRKMGQLRLVGGSSILADLVNGANEHSPVEYYARVMKGADARGA